MELTVGCRSVSVMLDALLVIDSLNADLQSVSNNVEALDGGVLA